MARIVTYSKKQHRSRTTTPNPNPKTMAPKFKPPEKTEKIRVEEKEEEYKHENKDDVYDEDEKHEEDEDEEMNEDEETIKAIVAVEVRKSSASSPPTKHCLVYWQGCDSSESLTWEPYSDVFAQAPAWKPASKRAWKDQEYTMARVWATRERANKRMYLVEWDGYPLIKDLTWEPAATVEDIAAAAIQEYLRAQWALDEDPVIIVSADPNSESVKPNSLSAEGIP